MKSEKLIRRPSLFAAWNHFWFEPMDAWALHVLRISTGTLLLFWLLTFMGSEVALFGLNGVFDLQAYQDVGQLPNGSPVPLGWSLIYSIGTNNGLVQAFYWCSIVIALLYTLGIATRLTSILVWVITISFSINPAIRYGADSILVIFTFYIMLGYLFISQRSGSMSLAERIFGSLHGSIWQWFSKSATPSETKWSVAANLAVRLFQVHFAIIMVTTGLHKLQFGDWWAGVAFWYPTHPPMETTFESIQASPATIQLYLVVITLAQYLMLAWQLAFPFFAWKSSLRWLLLLGGVIGWIGQIAIFGLPLFGPFVFVGCLSFLQPHEWRNLLGRFSRSDTTSVQQSSSPRRTPQPAVRT